MGILIVCPETLQDRVATAISRQAALDWRQKHEIFLMVIPDRRQSDSDFVTGRIRDRVQTGDISHVLAVHADVDVRRIQNRVYARTTRGIHSFERRELPEILKELGLDWLSQLNNHLQNGWHHGNINRAYLEQWIQQFEKNCGSHGWVAEGLLKTLEFWSDSRIREGLRLDQTGLSNVDCIVVNRHKRAGKSADAIASLVQKQLDSHRYQGLNGRVLDFRDALQREDINRILYVEDCLITGNEMLRVFLALMGRDDPFGDPKAKPLPNPEILREKVITLRFAVVANGGLMTINQFLTKESLTNISIDLGGSIPLVTLTESGLNSLRDNCLYDVEGCVANENESLARTSFTSLEIWGSENKASRAMEFCRTIGLQLYRNYLEKRGKKMSPKQLEQSALGIHGLALALAFSHSVPKETLPLFWMDGTVTWEAKQFQWLPLFESGA